MIREFPTCLETIAFRERLCFSGLTIDKQGTLYSEQAVGSIDDDRVHFSVIDINQYLTLMGIDKKSLVERSLDMQSWEGWRVPRGFELKEGKKSPVISIIFSEEAYSIVLAELCVTEAITYIQADLIRHYDDNGAMGKGLEKIKQRSLAIERSFVNRGARPVKTRRDYSPASVTEMRLSRFSGALIAGFFQENSIPGVYFSQTMDGQIHFSEEPCHHGPYNLESYLRWTRPAANKDSLINNIQLVAILENGVPFFSKPEVEGFVRKLNMN